MVNPTLTAFMEKELGEEINFDTHPNSINSLYTS